MSTPDDPVTWASLSPTVQQQVRQYVISSAHPECPLCDQEASRPSGIRRHLYKVHKVPSNCLPQDLRISDPGVSAAKAEVRRRKRSIYQGRDTAKKRLIAKFRQNESMDTIDLEMDSDVEMIETPPGSSMGQSLVLYVSSA